MRDIESETGSDMAVAPERALGLVDFPLCVHLVEDDSPGNSLAEIKAWAAGLPVPTYAIDDETAIKVINGTVDVVCEGRWKVVDSAK